jgi:hypothetical protein
MHAVVAGNDRGLPPPACAYVGGGYASFLSTRSAIPKYLIFICRVLLPLDALPLVSNSTLLSLSCNIIFLLHP